MIGIHSISHGLSAGDYTKITGTYSANGLYKVIVSENPHQIKCIRVTRYEYVIHRINKVFRTLWHNSV